MKTIDQWFEAYSKDHQHPTNVMIHKICVPLIVFSLLGLIWTLPTPTAFDISPFMNWSFVFVVFCLAFYLRLSFTYFVFMCGVAVFMFYGLFQLSKTAMLFETSLTIFVLAWVGQFVGHKIEGQKPSFLEDLQFLLIGPLWVAKDLPLLNNVISSQTVSTR